MEIEEFEKKYDKKDIPDLDDFVGDEGGEELLMQQDIIDGIALLTKVKTLLDYVSNVELCKTVTKREREVMAKVSAEVEEYLDSVSDNYEPKEDE